MISFEKYLNEDSDIKYINNIVIKKVSSEKSNIKKDFYDNHIIICAKISYELAKEKN